MKYELDFDVNEFKRIDRVVRATILANGRVNTWNSPRLVTTNNKALHKRHTAVCEEGANNDVRAICFRCTHNPHEFDIWVNPILTSHDVHYRVTLLHELCHGYIGPEKGHGGQWRRLFARALIHYSNQEHTIDFCSSLVDLANWTYTKRGRSETTDQFLSRIKRDKEWAYKVTAKESDIVKRILDARR
jgi:hypothetical protein